VRYVSVEGISSAVEEAAHRAAVIIMPIGAGDHE
jgi:hypothetical protein